MADDQDMQAAVEALKPHAVEAVDAMFIMCQAINTGGLCVMDLYEACKLAIAGGWDMALIEINMMLLAVRMAREDAGNKAKE